MFLTSGWEWVGYTEPTDPLSLLSWGWKFTAYPVSTVGRVDKHRLVETSDCRLLEQPVAAFVATLLETVLCHAASDTARQTIEELVRTKKEVFHQLVKVLTSCVHANLIGT